MSPVPKKNQFDEREFLMALSDKLKDASRAPNIKKYQPHAKQAIFHASLKKKKLYIGGNRSGKTTGGVTEAIWRATCRHPYRSDLNAIGPNRGRVIGVDFVNGVEKIIFPQYKQWLYPSALRGGAWETAYDSFGRTLNFSNGSFIEFMSYDQPLVKFAGTSRHWVHFDEEPPQPIYVENLARLIDTDGEFWITMTPVEGMTWVYDDLYEKNVNNDDGNVLVVEINTLENPYLSATAIESFLGSVDEDEVTSRIKGAFVQQGGRVFKNFDPVLGGVHVLEDTIDDPKNYFRNWLWICSLDHGLNNPTAVLWTALDQNGFGITFDEHYRREWTVDQHAKFLQQKFKEHGRMPDILVADPSIAARNGITGTSIQQEYANYGIYWTLGNNDVRSGIIRLKKYFNEHKYIGARNHPAFASDSGKDEYPMLRITPNCGNLIHELKRYRWKTYTNKKLQFENNPYDEPHKKDDHATDSLRYAIMTQPDLFADKETDSMQMADNIMQAFDELGLNDDTGFVMGRDHDIADPYDLLGNPRGWQHGDPIPVRNGQWEYDEHMGGLY